MISSTNSKELFDSAIDDSNQFNGFKCLTDQSTENLVNENPLDGESKYQLQFRHRSHHRMKQHRAIHSNVQQHTCNLPGFWKLYRPGAGSSIITESKIYLVFVRSLTVPGVANHVSGQPHAFSFSFPITIPSNNQIRKLIQDSTTTSIAYKKSCCSKLPSSQYVY